MAPALTQTVDPPNLADATQHSLPPAASTSPYDHLKGHGNIKKTDINAILSSTQTILTNGDCVLLGLAPPAYGRAEGRPALNNSPFRSNMDGNSPSPIGENNSENSRLSVSLLGSNMGLQSGITNVNIASGPEANNKGTEATSSNAAIEDSPAMLGNQNELLALVGRDFNNVNDIIDTLQRLASNPELLDAAARDLEPDSASNCNSQDASPEDRAANILTRLAERQRNLERRRSFLLRRLHRITSRGLGMTISNQVCQLIRHSRIVIEKERAKLQESEKKTDKDIGIETLHTESMKSMSTSDLISLVRRVEANQNMLRTNLVAKSTPVKEVIALPSSIRAQLDIVTANMKAAALGHLHHDSDATESSSGGESCDELEGFPKNNTSYKPIRERAYYRYCQTRGWVASKWMWLQTQISDLDSRINQQEELYSRIRASKGEVQLLDNSSNVQGRSSVRTPAHYDVQDPAFTCIASPSSVRSTINGYNLANKVDDASSSMHYINGGIPEHGGECARTLGIRKVKRRRYVRQNMLVTKRSLGDGGTTRGVYKYSDKVSSVQCTCVPPVSCILCAKSRFSSKNVCYGNYFLNSRKPDALAILSHPGPENLANLDPSFHPVLSKRTELLQSEYYKATMGSFEWQQKTLRDKPSTSSQPLKKEGIKSDHEDDNHESQNKRRKKDFKKNGKKYREDTKERITSYMHRSTRRTLQEFEEEYAGWRVATGSANSSPCPSPAPSDKTEKVAKDKFNLETKEGSGRVLRRHTTVPPSLPTTPSTVQPSSTTHRQKQNSTSNSYDINNIVIPYNMVASSRVELLKYKEIPTPKWRVDEIKPMAASMKNKVELEEDISEVAITARHCRSEAMERKKFFHYLQWQVNSSRSIRSRRTDSSGTNTPDHPLSPRPLEQGECSPMGSPPGTPKMCPSEDSNHSLPNASTSETNSQATVFTLSLSSLIDSNPNPNSSTEPINKHLINQSSYSEDCEQNDLTITEVPTSPTIATTSTTHCNSSSTPKGNCLTVLTSDYEGPPALRTRRLTSGNGFEKRIRSISISLGDELNETDRVSPFPCRDFPLTENDYQDLVIEDLAEDYGSPNEIIKPLEEEATDENQIKTITVPVVQDKRIDVENISTLQSGRDSPLSELTDSAPEEEGVWDDEATPDWTISAVHDHSGGLVLQVQRN